MTVKTVKLLAAATLIGSALAAAPASAAPHRHGDEGSSGSGCLPASLRHTLAEVSRRFGRVEVISAHRPGATISGSGRTSYHASCRAVDFNPPAGKYQQVANWLKANHSGGVGTYSCGMNHIHIDNGPSVRFHKCEGGGHGHVAQRRGGKRHASAGSRGRQG